MLSTNSTLDTQCSYEDCEDQCTTDPIFCNNHMFCDCGRPAAHEGNCGETWIPFIPAANDTHHQSDAFRGLWHAW